MRVISALLVLAAITLPALAGKYGGPVHTSSVGMNISGGQFNAIGANQTDQPFLNILKSNIGWGVINGNSCTGIVGNGWTNMQVNANGYPTTMVLSGTSGCSATEFRITTNSMGAANYDGSPAYSSGHYVLLYNGIGTVTVTQDCGFVESGGTGRDIYNCAPAGGNIQMHVTAINVGNPIRDEAFVYSPDSTGASGGNHVGVNEALYNGGEIWNPQFVARTKPFAALRFMDAFSILSNPTANWADRTPLGFYSYTLNPGDFVTPGSATNIGLPPEAAIALCNEILADCWLNVPLEYTSSAITSFAMLAHNTLNPKLRAIVEYGNEFFNSDFTGGAFSSWLNSYMSTQSGITGAGSMVNQGIVGSVAVNDSWLAVYGADAPTRLVRVLGGQAANGPANQFRMAYTLAGSFSGTAASHSTHFATAPYWDFVGQAYPLAWSGDADPYLKFFQQVNGSPTVIPAQSAAKCTTAGTTAAFTVSSNTANCGVSGVIPATPPNGTFIIMTMNATSTYGGFTASTSGSSLVVTAVSSGALAPGSEIGRSAGGVAEAFIVSGPGGGGTGTYTLDRSMGTIASTTWLASPVLTVDGGNTFPMTLGNGQDADGNGTFNVAYSGTQIFCFTTKTISGAVSPTWRQSFGDDVAHSGGYLGTMPTGVLYYTQNYSDATNAGLGLIGYESGQNFVPGNDATRQSWFYGAMRDARMGVAELSYLTQLKSVSHGALTMQYNQIGTLNVFGIWPTMEGVLMPGSPRYNAMQNFN